MSTQNLFDDAADTLDRAERDNNQRKTLWRCLSAYDMCADLEDFVAYLRLNPGPEAEHLYEITHMAYVEAWRRYGWDRLRQMIRIGWNGIYLHDGRLT